LKTWSRASARATSSAVLRFVCVAGFEFVAVSSLFFLLMGSLFLFVAFRLPFPAFALSCLQNKFNRIIKK
jgi:ABC-type multidrug transport system fused ATPase/permease subunit